MLPGLPMAPERTRHAACLGWAELDWIDPDPEQAQLCRVICAGCPVREQCLSTALTSGEPWGIWAARTPANEPTWLTRMGSRCQRCCRVTACMPGTSTITAAALPAATPTRPTSGNAAEPSDPPRSESAHRRPADTSRSPRAHLDRERAHHQGRDPSHATPHPCCRRAAGRHARSRCRCRAGDRCGRQRPARQRRPPPRACPAATWPTKAARTANPATTTAAEATSSWKSITGSGRRPTTVWRLACTTSTRATATTPSSAPSTTATAATGRPGRRAVGRDPEPGNPATQGFPGLSDSIRSRAASRSSGQTPHRA